MSSRLDINFLEGEKRKMDETKLLKRMVIRMNNLPIDCLYSRTEFMDILREEITSLNPKEIIKHDSKR